MKYLSLILTLITAIAAIYIGFFIPLSSEVMENLYINWIFYILLTNIILAAFAIIRTENKTIEWLKGYFKHHFVAVLVAAILMTAGAIVSKPDFRILADETNLLAMSQSLYEERECKNYTSILYYYYGFKDVISYVNDKRPALFPLTLSFCHSIFGYRPENIFALNLISGFLSLLLLYHLINKIHGRFWGICGMLLLAAYPLFILYTTSGGFETFNLLFSLILFWYLGKFIESPNAVSAEALLLLLPLISQTRYESAVAVFAVVPIILIYLPRVEYLKFGYKLPFFPLFFIPVAWLRLISDNANAWQVNNLHDSFSFGWFIRNSQQAIKFFFSEERNYGIIPLISVLAVFGLVFLLCDVFGKTRERFKLLGFSIFVFYFLHAVARFSYSMCDLTSVAETRLAMIFLPIIVFLAISFLSRFQEWLSIRRAYFLVTIVAVIVLYWPACGLTMGVRDLTLCREFRAAREFLEEHFPNKNEYIVVADRANMYVPLKYSAVSFAYVNNNPNRFAADLENRTHNYLIVIQMIDRNTHKPMMNCRMPDGFNLEKLYETQVKINNYLRISRWRLK